MSEKYTMKQTGSGGMAGSVQTPANAHLGQDKPKVFDADGAVGHQFTGMYPELSVEKQCNITC